MKNTRTALLGPIPPVPADYDNGWSKGDRSRALAAINREADGPEEIAEFSERGDVQPL